MPSEASRPFPRTGTGTRPESESISTACLEARRGVRKKRILRASDGPIRTGPLAGRPTVAGCALPGTAKNKNEEIFYPYGNILWTFLASAAWTSFNFFRRRIRLAFLVPSRCRLPECMRMIFPVDVILNRLAAPRCVLSLSFFTFFATNVTSLDFLLDRQACPPAGAPDGLVAAPPPRLGARSAIMMLA